MAAGAGNRAPITVFTGLLEDNPLRLIVTPLDATPLEISGINASRILQATELQKASIEIHKDVSLRKTKAREVAISAQNSKTHVQKAYFSVGDYVIVAKKRI